MRKKMTSERAARYVDAQTAAWGVERKPFESDGGYFTRVAAHWRERAQALISRERLEKAAEELWKLDRDCGRAPVKEWVTGSAAVIPGDVLAYEGDVRLIYLRRALTVLRHAGVEVDVPEELIERDHEGCCAPGYCRSQPACPKGVCRAVC